MRKSTKSIKFYISLFFIFLNLISFFFVFTLISSQYLKIAKRNVSESNQIIVSGIEQDFKDIKFYINELTLKMYSDSNLNTICTQLYKENYADESMRETLIKQAESACHEYLYSYSFIQRIQISIEDGAKTDICVRKSNEYPLQKEYRKELQEEIIAADGVLYCYEAGAEHRLVFARTLRDFENVLKDNRVIGTVMIFINPQYLENMLKGTLHTPNGISVFTNNDGVITYSTQKEILKKDFQQMSEERFQKKYQIFSKHIPVINQDFITLVLNDDISLSVEDYIKTLALAIVFIALLNLILILGLSRTLTKPMDDFVQQIGKIGVKNLETEYIHAEGYLEIENITEKFNLMLRRIENLVKENYAIGISEKNARIEALQSQINPHFIFNTLDTINWKVMFLDVPEVSNMISYLGDMLRYTTYQYGKYVAIGQEIDLIEKYLYIQEIRYSHSFKTYIQVDQKDREVVIPCLLIQPLIENAVVHGLKNKKKGVLVLRITTVEEMIKIMVFDNGEGMEECKINEILSGKGEQSVGLSNVNQRLKLIYSERSRLSIQSRCGGYTKIEFSIPRKSIDIRGLEE